LLAREIIGSACLETKLGRAVHDDVSFVILDQAGTDLETVVLLNVEVQDMFIQVGLPKGR
jgi:hypothetical protein